MNRASSAIGGSCKNPLQLQDDRRRAEEELIVLMSANLIGGVVSGVRELLKQGVAKCQPLLLSLSPFN